MLGWWKIRSQWHSGRWNNKADHDAKLMGSLLLRSSWHMLELYAVVLPSVTKHDSCKFVCNNKSLRDSVHPSEFLPFRNEWVVISIYSGCKVFLIYSSFNLFFCFVLFLLSAYLLSMDGDVALYFFPPVPLPPKIKRWMHLKLLTPIILT